MSYEEMSFAEKLANYVIDDINQTMEFIAEMWTEEYLKDSLKEMNHYLISSMALVHCCESLGVQLPLRYSLRMLLAFYNNFLVANPKIIPDADFAFADILLDNEQTKEQQRKASAMVRIALESVYGVKLADDTTLAVDATADGEFESVFVKMCEGLFPGGLKYLMQYGVDESAKEQAKNNVPQSIEAPMHLFKVTYLDADGTETRTVCIEAVSLYAAKMIAHEQKQENEVNVVIHVLEEP